MNMHSPQALLPSIRAQRPQVTVSPALGQVRGELAQPSQSPLWLHVHFPQLALEVLTRGVTSTRACVLARGEGKRLMVWKTNACAAILGVKPGMPVVAAHALGQFTVLERNARAEQSALMQLGQWAMQFSSQVSLVPEDGLLIEIGGSLKLFQGLDNLLRRLRSGLKGLGYRVQYAVAPMPLAATALARAGTRALVLQPQDVARNLRHLPVRVLDLAAGQQEALESIGVHELGECLRLSRGSLARRFSPSLLDIFDRLYGAAPDPRPLLPLPRMFESLLELPWEVQTAPALLLAGKRLLGELSGYLRACSAVTRQLRWRLIERDGHQTYFELVLTSPGRDTDHMLVLLRETLARLRLRAPIRALELRVTDITHGVSPVADLFKSRSGCAMEEPYAMFVDRMRSRYGDEALHGLQEKFDHRPEQVWSRRQLGLPMHRPSTTVQTTVRRSRPIWLLKAPQALKTRHGNPDHTGPLRLVSERERLEGAWWSAQSMARDYFIATSEAWSRLWVYRERDGKRRWFLHGIFE
jgi:protein ImuB